MSGIKRLYYKQSALEPACGGLGKKKYAFLNIYGLPMASKPMHKDRFAGCSIFTSALRRNRAAEWLFPSGATSDASALKGTPAPTPSLG